MKLESWQKTGVVLDRIAEITEASFVGDELPPRSVLEYQFNQGTIFVNAPVIDSYAVLVEKFEEPHIWSIATDPEVRGRGFAGELLDEIEKHARAQSQTGISLTVHADNIAAQKLYLNKGYRVTKVLANHYLTGNGLFLRRTLTQVPQPKAGSNPEYRDQVGKKVPAPGTAYTDGTPKYASDGLTIDWHQQQNGEA